MTWNTRIAGYNLWLSMGLFVALHGTVWSGADDIHLEIRLQDGKPIVSDIQRADRCYALLRPVTLSPSDPVTFYQDADGAWGLTVDGVRYPVAHEQPCRTWGRITIPGHTQE